MVVRHSIRCTASGLEQQALHGAGCGRTSPGKTPGVGTPKVSSELPVLNFKNSIHVVLFGRMEGRQT